MSYRDDADALFERAAALQREVDQMREELATRDRELAEAKGTPFQRTETSPGLRAIRELPPAEELFSRLIDSMTATPPPSPQPPPIPKGAFPRKAMLEHADALVALLSDVRLSELVVVLEKLISGNDDVSEKFHALVSAAARRA